MKRFRVGVMAGVLILGLGGCASDNPNRRADSMARSAGLQRVQIPTDGFVLTGYYRITRMDQPLTVYIEGDGFAWRSRHRPALDPTPRNAVGLALASVAAAPNLLYLARPCQFTPRALNPRCTSAYWTDRRFAEDVIVAMDQAVSGYAERLPGQPLHLVGYSGGAAIAVLIAARRHDVSTLRTVAGNLDMDEVNRLHGVSAMPGSLNALDVASRLAPLAQIHYSGAYDTVVPSVIAQRFARAVGGHCTQIQTVPDMGHTSDWSRLWPVLLKQLPACR